MQFRVGATPTIYCIILMYYRMIEGEREDGVWGGGEVWPPPNDVGNFFDLQKSKKMDLYFFDAMR